MRENLASAVNDAARKITVRGKEAIVPLKFDKSGNPVGPQSKLLFKRLTLDDLRFLQVWREVAWDVGQAQKRTGIDGDRLQRLVKKLACFREEDAKVKALCEIPTADWITAKHVENLYTKGGLEDSEHKSLQELAKIEGAYKNTAQLSITQNIFNLPKMSPESEAKLKAIAEAALDAEEVA